MYYRNYSYYINMILHNIKYNTGKTLDMTYSTGLKPNECLNSFSFIGVFKINTWRGGGTFQNIGDSDRQRGLLNILSIH